MSIKSIPITIKAADTLEFTNQDVGIPSKIYKFLNKSTNIDLKVSTFKTEVSCYENNTDNIIDVPGDIAKKMYLFPQMTTNMLIANDQIFLGPVIGVFVSNGQVRKAKKQHPYFRLIEYSKANEEAKTILYFFSIKDVDSYNLRIHGTYYNKENGRFEENPFPYPDILYDRGGGTLRSQKKKSWIIREDIDKKSKPLKINPTYFFDKWEVYKSLLFYDEVSPFLPESFLYQDNKDLSTMFESYSTIYIKDCLGNNSTGVAKLEKFMDNTFKLNYFKNEIFTNNFSSFYELQSELNNLFRSKKTIIQAAIDVIEVDCCNADMRAEIQRNGKGEVEISPYMVRIGGNESHVTNTKSGGMVYLFDDVFKNKLNYPDEKVEQIKSKIKDFLLTIFEAIEDVYGTFGELGIDFALDKDLNIWFIECNAKPGKDTIYLAGDDKDVHRSFSNPLNYGKFLWENRRSKEI